MMERWITEEFRLEPCEAIRNLISGRAGVGSNLRLDLPELLYQAFPKPNNLADERAQLDRVQLDRVQLDRAQLDRAQLDRAQLDRALSSWLIGMREDYAEQVKRLGFPVFGKRVGDVLIALQLLDLPEAKRRIRKELATWLRWLEPLRLAPERDPALECLRLLTRGQPDARHAGLWLRLAVDPRPEYLTVALAGLQLLPNEDNARTNHTLMLQGLLRHAVKIKNEANAAHTFFSERFAALRGFFPRDHQHWKRVLSEALDGFLKHTEHRQEELAAKKLAETLLTNGLAERYRSSSVRVARPVPQAQWRRLLDDIRASVPPETLARRLFEISEQNHRYAKATGVSHFFVRTLHYVGDELLKQHQLGRADMNRLGIMIERALIWEPANPYCWMLWADWLRAQGHREGRESTLREMLRLFPNNAHARVELARLLITQGERHWDEAEHWLRQAMQRAPDSEPARVVMARLLVLRHRNAEAKAILAKFLERYPDKPTAQQSLERLRAGVHDADAGSGEDGESAIRDAIDRGDGPASLSNALSELVRRSGLAIEFSRAQVAQTNGHGASTNLIKRETMNGDPLAGFYSQWLMPDETPECPPHAWAWNACRYWQQPAQPDGWQHLAKQFPEAHPETEFLRILAAPESENRSAAAEWRALYCTGADADAAPRPVDVFMCQEQERLESTDRRERDRLAVELMACAAAGAPELGLESAA